MEEKMKCLQCKKEIDYYLQISILEPTGGWMEKVYYPLQGCEECIPTHEGKWESDEK
jgi:hypothetical protein